MNYSWYYYVIFFGVGFVLLYLVYYFLAIRSQILFINNRSKKKSIKELPEMVIFEKVYKININKIGRIRVLRIVNFTNALLIDLLVLCTFLVDSFYLKLLIIVVLMIPSIWFTYYVLSRILKLIERKSE